LRAGGAGGSFFFGIGADGRKFMQPGTVPGYLIDAGTLPVL
jgi:hypothetical protein